MAKILKKTPDQLFSMKMRASQGGPHEEGGRHISGQERIVDREHLESCVHSMIERAHTHQRGFADFINIKIELIDLDEVAYKPILKFSEVTVHNLEEGRQAAFDELVAAGVSEKAARNGIDAILALPDSMRGAMIMDAVSGERLDNLGMRGVRVSDMDVAKPEDFKDALDAIGLTSEHAREAMVLAAKVASSEDSVAELCWSDDPQYTIGYVASPKNQYRRIPYLKPAGDMLGGRVFYVKPGTDIQKYRNYMEHQITFITANEDGYITDNPDFEKNEIVGN